MNGGYCVRVIRPADYPHSRVFDQTATAIELCLIEEGVWDSSGRPIVFGANLLPLFPSETICQEAILFNLEAWSSPWFSDAYTDTLRRHPVLDYATQNVDWLQERGVKAMHCPIRYHHSLTRLKLRPEETTVDVLFYGSMTERRIPILQSIEATGLRCKWLDHDRWDERDHWIERSKIVLNLHAYEGSPLEWVRLAYLLSNGAFVLSEGASDMDGYEIASPLEHMPDQCLYWARKDGDRDRSAQKGSKQFMQQRQADVLLSALKEIG